MHDEARRRQDDARYRRFFLKKGRARSARCLLRPRVQGLLRNLLRNEPHVRGLGYNQYADEIEDIEGVEADPEGKTLDVKPFLTISKAEC